jgi:hypothetical protein
VHRGFFISHEFSCLFLYTANKVVVDYLLTWVDLALGAPGKNFNGVGFAGMRVNITDLGISPKYARGF